jgi:hypothetical protein
MKRIIFSGNLALAFSICLVLAACNNNSTTCDPDLFCDTVRPTSATLTMKITIDDENQWVPIALYFGDVSDSALYFRDTVNATSFSYTVPVDKKYGAMVKYHRGNATILAIDGGRCSTSKTENCDEECFSVNDLTLRMELAN